MNGYMHQMDYVNYQSQAFRRQQAVSSLFVEKYLRARINQLVYLLVGRSVHPQSFEDVRRGRAVRSSRYAGMRVVALDQIVGSEGRSDDFDAHFNPVQLHNRRRWENMAKAFLRDIPLPPVSLIQIGKSYFIRDGHHRVSVALAMGQESIDAEVIVYELE